MSGKIYRKRPKKQKQKKQVDREKLKLIRKTQEQINQVNKRMEKLLQAGYEGTWSSKKFLNRIYGTKISGSVEVIRKRGKIAGIKLKPTATKTSLYAIHKASRQFLESKTSTVSGIKSVRDETIKSLKRSLSDFDKELTDDDVEFLYEMLEIQEMQDITEMFGASRMWSVSQDAIEANDTKEEFLERFEREISTINDNEMKRKAEKLYEYISKK